MAKSTRKSRREKPSKPTKDFPLFPHANGQWAKKVRGDLHYFGKWENPKTALNLWLDQKDDLLAGRTPRKRRSDELTVKGLADRFLTVKLNRHRTGELSADSYRDYVYICQHVADVFGKNRLVSDLMSADFEELRTSFAKRHGVTRLMKDITVTRMLFRWGYESGLLETSVRFGPDFRPPKKTHRRKARATNGKRYFTADELRPIIDAANGQLKAMILLGVNCGFGNKDVADLQESHIDLQRGWVAFPRPKTGIERRCKLWAETIVALKEALAMRPAANDPGDEGCVFITRQHGRFVRLAENEDPAKRGRVDAVGKAFKKLLDRLGINGRRGFYAIRHSFRTAAAAAKDKEAADFIMGHARDDMASEYIEERPSDERLRDVANVVRAWLWPDTIKSETETETTDAAESGQADAGESG